MAYVKKYFYNTVAFVAWHFIIQYNNYMKANKTTLKVLINHDMLLYNSGSVTYKLKLLPKSHIHSFSGEGYAIFSSYYHFWAH